MSSTKQKKLNEELGQILSWINTIINKYKIRRTK